MECKSCDTTQKESHEKVGKINTEGLNALIRSKTAMTLIDARSPKFDDGRRIGPAISLNSEASSQELQKAIPSKDALVVVYCRNLNCPASQRVVNLLVQHGYTNIIKYDEGIEGWITAGFSVR